MKYAVVLLSFCVLSAASSAQDWQCVQPGTRIYFTNAAHYLHGMRIDSVRNTANGSTLFFPYRTPRGSYAVMKTPLDTAKGSWLGQTIEALPSGRTYVYNYWSDTVVVETKAGIGASWTLYNDTTSVYYLATVVATDTMTIGGALDSVKEIMIQAWQGVTMLSGNPINKFHLLLSRQHGFQHVFDLYMFPYHRPDSPAVSQFDYLFDQATSGKYDSSTLMFARVDFANPDYATLYGFQAGDIYQTKKITAAPGITEEVTDTVVSRTIAAGNLSFGIRERTVSLDNAPGYPYPSYSIRYTNYVRSYPMSIAELVDTALMPEEWGNPNLYWYNPDDNSYCFKSTAISIRPSFVGHDGIPNTFEPCGERFIYKLGLALVQHDKCFDPYPNFNNYESRMSYVNSTMTLCGSLGSLSTGNHLKGKRIGLSPNPAHMQVMLDIPASIPANVSVADALGRIVFKSGGDVSGLITIDTSAWSAGSYFVVIRSNHEVVSYRLGVMH